LISLEKHGVENLPLRNSAINIFFEFVAKSQKKIPCSNELILTSIYQMGCYRKILALSLNLHETIHTSCYQQDIC